MRLLSAEAMTPIDWIGLTIAAALVALIVFLVGSHLYDRIRCNAPAHTVSDVIYHATNCTEVQ
jgi:hypothetical protein